MTTWLTNISVALFFIVSFYIVDNKVFKLRCVIGKLYNKLLFIIFIIMYKFAKMIKYFGKSVLTIKLISLLDYWESYNLYVLSFCKIIKAYKIVTKR